MERRRTSARPRRLVGAAGVALLLLGGATACGDDGPFGRGPVATVNGVDISHDEVSALVDGQVAYVRAASKAARKAADAAPEDATAASTADQAEQSLDGIVEEYGGTGRDTVGATGAASVLSSLIEVEVTRAALEEAGGEVTDAERDDLRTQLLDQLKEQGISSTAGFDALVDLEVERQALRNALQASVSQPADERTAQLEEAYESQLADLSQHCVALIVTADEASSQAAFARLTAGEDFAAVAAEVSTDEQTAGAGGGETCVADASLAAVFGEGVRTAQPGSLVGPGEGQGAWLIARVNSINVPTFEDARADLEAQIPDTSETAVTAALAEAAKAADVTVDTRYGTWDGEQGVVVPPEDPDAPTTTIDPSLVAGDPTAGDPAPAGS